MVALLALPFPRARTMETQSLADIGKVEALRQLLCSVPASLKPGRAFAPAARSTVRSASRLFSEGSDFNLIYFPLKHLGYKCTVCVTGELLATLARPRLLNVVIGLSAKLGFSEVKTLWSGIVEAAREMGFEGIDLDLVPSRNGLYISINAVGETAELSEKRRPAPKTKDLICVTGSLGAAYLGMQVLERGQREFEKTGQQPSGLDKYKMLIGAYLKPELSPDLVARFEEAELYPSCGYPVRNGLADTVKRLVADTGLGAKVYADKIPFEGNSFALGRELDIDPVSAAMSGGEDCQLLFTIPILQADRLRHDFQTLDIIGHLAEPSVGAVLVTPDGAELPVHAPGWEEE